MQRTLYCSEFDNSTIIDDSFSLDELSDAQMATLLGELRLSDALVLAEKFPELRDSLIDGFLIPRCKFDQKTILIGDKSIRQNPDQIKIEDFSVILRFLRVFGNEVTKIEIYGDYFIREQIQIIGEHIAQYCSESLVSITIENALDYLLSETSQSLPNVLNVKVGFAGRLNIAKIYQVYPSVQNLAIIRYGRPFPPGADTVEIRKLLPFTPQLRSLRLKGIIGNGLLETIRDYLTELEDLSFQYNTNAPLVNPIHFASVKNLSLDMLPGTKVSEQPFPLSFDRLENLEIFAEDSEQVPTQLITDSKHLKSFSLPWTRSDYTIDQVLDNLYSRKHLEHVTIYWSMYDRPAANTLSLIANFQQLTKITFALHGDPVKPEILGYEMDEFRSLQLPEWLILSIELVSYNTLYITIIPESKLELFLPQLRELASGM